MFDAADEKDWRNAWGKTLAFSSLWSLVDSYFYLGTVIREMDGNYLLVKILFAVKPRTSAPTLP